MLIRLLSLLMQKDLLWIFSIFSFLRVFEEWDGTRDVPFMAFVFSLQFILPRDLPLASVEYRLVVCINEVKSKDIVMFFLSDLHKIFLAVILKVVVILPGLPRTENNRSWCWAALCNESIEKSFFKRYVCLLNWNFRKWFSVHLHLLNDSCKYFFLKSFF